MATLFKFKDLCNISKDFYNLFESNTKQNKELEKYVLHAVYTFDCVEHDCKLTFYDWALKHKHISKKLKEKE